MSGAQDPPPPGTAGDPTRPHAAEETAPPASDREADSVGDIAGNIATLPFRSLGQGAAQETGSTLEGLPAVMTRRQMLAPYWGIYQNFDSLPDAEKQAAITEIRRATIQPHPPNLLAPPSETADWRPPASRRPYLPPPVADWLINQLRYVPQAQKAKTFEEFAGTPAEQTALYRSGDALKQRAEGWVSPGEKEQYPFLTGTFSLLGHAVPSVAATLGGSALVGPEIAVLLGAGQAGLSAAGDQFDRALAKQAEPPPPIAGMWERPNIDLARVPGLPQEDGSVTLAAQPVAVDGEEVLLPGIGADGQRLSESEAIAQYRRTGQHLGRFADAPSAARYAQQLDRQQSWLHGPEGEAARSQAAREAFAGSALLGSLPLGAILRPVQRSAPGLMPWVTAKALQYAQTAPAFATIGEAQEWLSQKIARENYDPDAAYSPDVRRMAANLLTAGLAMVHPLGNSDAVFDEKASRGLFTRLFDSVVASTPEEQAGEVHSRLQDTLRDVRERLDSWFGPNIQPGDVGTYTHTIKWGRDNQIVRVRAAGPGLWGNRVTQTDPAVDAYELKVNPNNESYFLPTLDGKYVQFENATDNTVQDAKLASDPRLSWYRDFARLPGFARAGILENARRQLDAAALAGMKLEWLVSDNAAARNLDALFRSEGLRVKVTHLAP